jgi:murein DD-endopeptidase MepM/ murein hydrolase activator NlpD
LNEEGRIAKNFYMLPVNISNLQANSPGRLPFNSHDGTLRFALDFLVPETSSVFAAADGEVVYVKRDSNIGGPDRKFWNDGNRIVIRHTDGEYSAYEHLAFNGALVEVGDFVSQGQLIGYSGNTGCTLCPHLHFEVFVDPVADESEGTTVRVVFVGFGEQRYGEPVTRLSLMGK